jgi:membrane protease YdiL (CAAX protease family)
MPSAWWVFLAAGVPAVFYAGAVITGSIGQPFPFDPWPQVLPALAAALLLGPIEELGWRGLALPLLQRRFAPVWAGLIVGGVWAIWHLPAFVISGTPQHAWSFAPYFVGVVALSVIVTPMFNASRGSLLVPMLFHFQANNPLWPDAQPWDSVLFAAVALAIVVLNRRRMLDRDSSVETVVAGERP